MTEAHVPPEIDGDWAPNTTQCTDHVSAAAAVALHELLDGAGEPPGNGDPVPPLWHWLAFRPRSRQHDLGPDGHPRTGRFLPPAGGRRRMAAGGRVTMSGPLSIDQVVTRTARVTQVMDKNGSTGPLRFVTVEATICGSPDQAIKEIQDFVYRGPAGSGPAAEGHARSAGRARSPYPVAAADESTWSWARDVPIDPTLLFRFSALTYNAHRIHYDRDYATAREGYPGLVVHGPLQAILLAELVRTHTPHRHVAAVEFRALAAAFDDGPLHLRGRLDTESASLAAFDHHGTPTMTATITFLENTS